MLRPPRPQRYLLVATALATILPGALPGGSRAESTPGAAAAPAGPVETGAGLDSTRFVLSDTLEIVARRDPLAGLSSSLSRYRYTLVPGPPAAGPVPVATLLRPRFLELSRFSCAMQGAGLGVGTASAIGGAGLVSGLWRGKTAGYLMGAGAVLGAFWGGTAGANDARFRVRATMGETDPAAARHEDRPE